MSSRSPAHSSWPARSLAPPWPPPPHRMSRSARPGRSCRPQFPRWDAGGSLGLLVRVDCDTGIPWGGLGVRRPTTAWTSAATGPPISRPRWRSAPPTRRRTTKRCVWWCPGSRRRTPITTSTVSSTPSPRRLTWQFLENTFMHPYVSGGVKIGILQEHRYRQRPPFARGPSAIRCRPSTSDAPPALARPFVAGGFKSYISRAVFVRTEGRAGVSARTASGRCR